jgi:Skp family chaperone for outer membrane proteins
MFFVIPGICALVAAATTATATATATTIASVSVGLGVAATVAKKVADIVEEENYVSIQNAKKKANNKIKNTKQSCEIKKNETKIDVLTELNKEIEKSSLNANSKKILTDKINSTLSKYN